MDQRCSSDKKLLLTKNDLRAWEHGECEIIILSHSELQQSDVNLITENFAYATYLDLSCNEKIASITFLLTPTTLYLRRCTSLRDITYRFPTCTLKNLDIVGCSIDIEEHFAKYEFPMLESLALSWQPNVKWHKLFGKLKALQSLTVENLCSRSKQVASARECQHGWQAFLTVLTEHKNIKNISFGNIHSRNDIVHLGKLTGRELGFHFQNDVVDCLPWLCSQENLYTIYLEHGNNAMDAHLLKVIMTCPNLKKITLDYCDGVTKEFIFKAAEFLKERDKDEPLKSRLQLEIFNCAGISEDIQADPFYAKAESALSLTLFFKCRYPTSDYRNDLIIPYPAPNVRLSIYILFAIFKRLKHRSTAQAFACVCEDFENAAIEEERHLKVISCRKAKIVNNHIYDAYHEIISDNKEFFKNRLWSNATEMKLHERVVTFQNIFHDFPQLKRLKLLNCAIDEGELIKNVKYENVTDLEICGENAMKLWRILAVCFPNITTVHLTYTMWEQQLGTAVNELPKITNRNMFKNVTSLAAVGIVLHDVDLKCFRQLKSLKIFSLCQNSHITGKYISDLRSIEELQLKHCKNIQQYYLAEILLWLPLKSLDITDCPAIFTSIHHTNEMWLSCEKLRKLKIDWQNEHTITIIQILNTLENIEVRGCVADFSEVQLNRTALEQQASADYIVHLEQQRLFRTLTERTRLRKLTLEAELLNRNLGYLQRLQHLTHLSVIALPLDVLPIAPNFYQTIARLANLEYIYLANLFYCYDGLMHIVERCRRLKVVKLRDCVGFSDFAIYDIVEVVKRTRMKEQLPLSLYMHNSKDELEDNCSEESYGRVAIEDTRFEDVAAFIKVVFVEEHKQEMSALKPPFLDEVLHLK